MNTTCPHSWQGARRIHGEIDLVGEGRLYSRDLGILDFVNELSEMHPDCFVVNADGNIPKKRVRNAKLPKKGESWCDRPGT